LLVVAGGRPPAGNLPKIWLHGSGVAGKRQPKGKQAVVMPCYAANATKAAGRHHTPVLASGWGLDDMPGPVDRSQRQLVQEGVSDGFEYFLYAGPVQDTDILVNLLKAYSLFKKRQQSSMKLLIANTGHGSMQPLRHMLETYKYRQDVLLCRPGSWQEALPLVGAAYALVDPRPQPELPLLWTAAWKAGVPLLCQKQSLPLLADGEPALTFQGAEPQAMAPALMQIYKDENMRSWLAQQGMEQAARWTWPQSVQQLEALLQQPMG
jgi:glycosyltransferase involved in cell wall biosynthesis